MIRRRWLLAATSILIVGSLAPPAAADEYDVLNLVVGGSVTHDSNLFRLPDSRSDTISTGYVGLRIDKPYAQQRFQLDVTETASRYREFSNLDLNALSYRGAWLWHLSPRVSGTLSAVHTESLASFEETTGTQRNVRISDNRIFNLDGSLFGGWHVLMGVSQSEQKSEQPFQPVPDFRSVSGEAGIKYLASSGSSIAVTQRLIRGNYLNTVVDPNNSRYDGYRQYESELNASWILNGHSTVTGRLAWLERHNDIFTQGDFSGLAGNLGYGWTPTAKLRLDFSARRDIRPYVDTFSNSTYEVDNVLSLGPTWQATAKIAVRAHLEYGQSYFRGGSAAPTVLSRRDTRTNALLGVNWSPLRSISVGASLEHQRRSSNDLPFNYETTIASVNASLMF